MAMQSIDMGTWCQDKVNFTSEWHGKTHGSKRHEHGSVCVSAVVGKKKGVVLSV